MWRATLAAMASSKKFQAPRGTRDFYPADMAVRRYIENVWRTTSINHGFDEVDGPTFEHLELYTHKSGPGIVSELFSFTRAGGETEYALRPEFTPTLARMIAARAAELPKPIKWFAIPGHYRAERPQRGRLREFFQWNVDYVGGEVSTAMADAEVIGCALAALERFGLTPADVKIRLNHRDIPKYYLLGRGAHEEMLPNLYDLADRSSKMDRESLHKLGEARGVPEPLVRAVEEMIDLCRTEQGTKQVLNAAHDAGFDPPQFGSLVDALRGGSGDGGTVVDPSIVRGLAYYTGTVFELIAEGERAVAGGGRYDRLIESFGGPPMPACGFGMGDVVLGLLLHDKGLLPEDLYMQPLRPHVFVIAASDDVTMHLLRIVAQLRKAGFHVRHSYRATRNVGKLLGEAGKARSRTAIILGQELAEGRVVMKDLEGGEQREIALTDLQRTLQEVLDSQGRAGV